MNQQSAKLWLPLVQALAEGKLQRNHPTMGWIDTNYLNEEDRDPNEFRCKPEPRRWWLVEGSGTLNHTAYPFGTEFDASVKYIEVVEVLK